MAKLVFISEKNRERYLSIIKPFGTLLSRIGVHPNVITICGLMLSVLAGLFYSVGSFFGAAWVVVLAGTCDALDGQLARKTKQNSPFGAFFDSTLDRYSDMFLYLGLAYYFSGGQPFILPHSGAINSHASPWTVFIVLMAMAGSFMVSYTRARAEGLGIECKVGLMQRPERILLLIIGSLLGPVPKVGPLLLKFSLLLLAVSSNITAIHRIVYISRKILKENRVS